jgi:hypothetical protein
VAPDISRLGRRLGPIRLHSCGTSDHLLPAFADIELIQSLDTGGGTSLATARDVLGNDFPIEIAPLVDHLTGPTAEPLLAWGEQVMDQNANGPLSIVYHLEQGYNLSHIRSLNDKIRSTETH